MEYFINYFQRIFLGDDFLKISCIKYAKDLDSFKVFENFGAKVVKLENPEDVDSEIKNLFFKKKILNKLRCFKNSFVGMFKTM